VYTQFPIAGDEASDHLHGLTDTSPGNVAFTCNQAFTDCDEEFTEAEALEEILGKPITATYIGKELPQTPHLPQQIVRTADWRMWYDCPREDIRIFDWGSAFSLSERPTFVSQPDDLSPETIFAGSFDYRHDLWKAGSVVCVYSEFDSK
jgi:serine/threonine-protein kinase SRPK3